MEDLSVIEFYSPLNCKAHAAKIGFIDLTDNWSQQELIDLKEKYKLQVLLGLQAEGERTHKSVVVDGVITCASSDNHLVMKVFSANLKRNTLEEDIDELIKAFKRNRTAKFVQVQGNKVNDEEQGFSDITRQLLNRIPETESIELIILNIVSESFLSLNEFRSLIDNVQSRAIEDYTFFYHNDIDEDVAFDWIGAIYIAN